MYRILDRSENGVVGIRVESKLTTEEYELLNAYLEQLMQEVGPSNFLCEMADVEGLNCQTLWEEITGHLRSLQSCQRIAVVGNRQWLEGGTNLFAPWDKIELKKFTPDQTDEAWNWVKG
jgi:hypothetical protein